MSNKKFDFFNHINDIPSTIYVALGIIFIAIHVAICNYTEVSPITCGVWILIAYALSSGAILIFTRKRIAAYKAENSAAEEQNSGVIAAFRDFSNIPYAVITEAGKIITVNTAFQKASDTSTSLFNTDIANVCFLELSEIIKTALSGNTSESVEDEFGNPVKEETKNFFTFIKNRKYKVDCAPIRTNGSTYYILIFNDVTELTHITDLYYAETPAVAYIVIDNLDEIAQYVKGSYRAEANQVENILKDFAEKMDGVIREYDRDKYIMFFNRHHLGICIKNKFDVLDDIRTIRIGDDSIPLTVSMGIAITGETLAEREHDALTALDLALQRGGDQVVVKNDKGVNYFGGLTKSQQKRTRVHSRVIANKLAHEISTATNVVVMGHANPDFDSIGACVGIASLAMYIGVDVKIVTDLENPNFIACTAKLTESEEYKNIFIDGVDGLEKFNYGTLLVIVDANNFSILESPEIAEKSLRTVVIDHHIKKEEFKNEPALTYIDPSASSACELISEILEQSLPVGTLNKEAATVMLSGIMVDTKNFTRTVGTRTFSAALYLRGAGANAEIARTFFEEAFEDYRAEAIFGASVEIYREQIAITASEPTGSANDRIAAAKAADKLLTVKNVNAAFALVKIGDVIHVSARSNGKINVQLILEQIGGGGHFDMAGAALSDKTIHEAKAMLKDAIDKHF